MKVNEKSLISVDLGTSSIRACLVNDALQILYQKQSQVDMEMRPGGVAVQDAEVIVEKGIAGIQEVLQWAHHKRYQPQAICFSNANASLVCLDGDYSPVGPAMTYLDLRAHQQTAQLINDFGMDYFTTNAAPMHASYWLPKFMWLKENDMAIPAYHQFCTIKDLLLYRLTGQLVIDKANAAATGMLDVLTGQWDQRLLKIAGIRLEQLPEIVPTSQLYAIHNMSLFQDGCSQTDLKVVVGAMDGVLSSLGAGAYRPGQVTTMIGSSGACRIAAKTPLTSCHARKIWSYPLDDDIWIRGGAMNSGGVVTHWLAENFISQQIVGESAYAEIFQSAASVPAGAEGLVFLPYLFGERAPIYNEKARGVFFGIASHHNKNHFVRAGLEGIIYALYSIFESLQISSGEVEVRATGGYLQSALMLQIQADIFGIPILVPAEYEGSIIGAAIVGFKALGWIDTYDDISSLIKIESRYLPDPKNMLVYRRGFETFKAIYQHLQPLFDVSSS